MKKPAKKVLRRQQVRRPVELQPRSLKPKQRAIVPLSPSESMEKMLMRLILNTSEVTTERKVVLLKSNPYGVQSEKREAMFLNPRTGVQQKIREHIHYVGTYKDGTPAGDSGLVQCQTCGEIVSEDSLERCPCGKTCCISKGCGVYVERHGQWYCCKRHALMKSFKSFH